jgi:hypothetical protein
MTSLEGQTSTDTPTRPRIRSIALPTEHGGWGFTLEPILLGLLVAPSASGWEISAAALGIFLARRPVRIFSSDLVRRRWLPRSTMALIFSIVHLVLNWKVLLNYLRDRAHHVYRLRAELVTAALLTVVVVVGSVLYLPPFSTVMDLGETFTQGWDTASIPVIPEEHEEENTLETTGDEDTLETHEEGEGPSVGWGRFTVEELCAQRNIPVEDGLSRLADYGIEADASSRVRTLADTMGYSPADVVDMILGLELGTTEAAD